MLLSGRIRFHPHHPRPETRAYPASDQGRLARIFAPPPDTPPGHSGLRLLKEGRDAYLARLGLAELAEHSLDAQYFIWEDDRIGLVLLERLMAAAERGVRVRLLIDDVHNSGRDLRLAALDAHANVEVRVFNPFGSRQWPLWRALELLRDFSRLNYRMHNKAWIADNSTAIVGGRNIGEHYFGLHAETNFRDLDLFVAGPAVSEISAAFDAFWNSAWAIPIASLVLKRRKPRHAARLARRLRRQIAALPGFPYPVQLDAAELEARLEPDMVWAAARVVHDPPDKLARGGTPVWDALNGLFAGVERECLLESAYFVPGPEDLTRLNDLSRRGVRLRALTNSLASTDVLVAHAAYAKHRPALLAAGVELHELRPDSPLGWRRLFRRRRRSRSALHAKAGVFDTRWVMLGSFNLDARSIAINTELVLIVDSPELAERLRRLMDASATPSHSWRVRTQGRGLLWEGEGKNGSERWTREPRAGWWRRGLARLLSWLPLDKQV